MTLYKPVLRKYLSNTNIVYHAKKNKQKYTQQQQMIKRQFHTSPPTPPNPPNTPIVLVLGLITSYYIYQNTPRDPPPPPPYRFGLY